MTFSTSTRLIAAAFAIAASFALAACGGGGGGSLPQVPAATATPTAAPLSPLTFQGVAPISVSTSPITASSTSTAQIEWSVIPDSGSVCLVSLTHGATILTFETAYGDTQIGGSFIPSLSGVYTLSITARIGSTCSIVTGGGTLTWPM